MLTSDPQVSSVTMAAQVSNPDNSVLPSPALEHPSQEDVLWEALSSPCSGVLPPGPLDRAAGQGQQHALIFLGIASRPGPLRAKGSLCSVGRPLACQEGLCTPSPVDPAGLLSLLL